MTSMGSDWMKAGFSSTRKGPTCRRITSRVCGLVGAIERTCSRMAKRVASEIAALLTLRGDALRLGGMRRSPALPLPLP